MSGALPGAGSTIAIGVSTGIIVKMYISLGKMLGIHIGNGVLKAMASALVADVAGSVAASLGASTILSFVPGIGTLGAAAIRNYKFRICISGRDNLHKNDNKDFGKWKIYQ